MGLFSGIGSFFGGPLGGLLGGIGDDLLGRDDAEDAAQQQMAQARTLRQTAYQDTTKDLQAAGLNPMLAYSNGATSASMPTLNNKGQSAATQNSAHATMENLKADTENKAASRDLLEAQAAEVRSRIPMNTNSAVNTEQQTKNLQVQADKIREEITLVMRQGLNEIDRGNLLRAQERLAEMEQRLKANTMTLQDAQVEYQNVITYLKGLEGSEGEARSDYWKSEMGKKQPYAEGAERYGDAAGSVIGGVLKKVIPQRGPKNAARKYDTYPDGSKWPAEKRK